MRAKHRKRTILLALTSTHHGFYRGAARYAAEHDWHVVADMIYDAAIPIGWKGDGILSFVGHWEDLAKYVLSAGVPVVEISSVRKDLGIPCVIEDNEAIVWAPLRFELPCGLSGKQRQDYSIRSKEV